MKKIVFISALCLCAGQLTAQVSGSINYMDPNAGMNILHHPNQNTDIAGTPTLQTHITIKGMANVKADTYVAIFNVSQVGKTTEEVNALMDQRLSAVKSEIDLKKGVEMYVDMLSFVPVYELEEVKKVFSKKTYNEVPSGFELRKNIHLKYTNPNQLNEFIALLSKNEIYDLVKVDYFSSTMEAVKKELMLKAKNIAEEKMKNMESLLGTTFNNDQKFGTDGYKVVLPMEMYQSYEAYSNSGLNLRRTSIVNRVYKPQIQYYQPVVDKEFDFVINPNILEPVIQVMYELKIMVNRTLPVVKIEPVNKEYVMISPAGDLKTLNLKP